MANTAKLRNMAGIYILNHKKILLLYRKGSKVVNNTWIASAGGHFEEWELNDAKYMMEHYLATGRYDDKVYVGVAAGTKAVFTELAEY